jgi:hypothetical protein
MYKTPGYASYDGVDWNQVQELRIVVSIRPPAIGRGPIIPCPADTMELSQLATDLLAPLLAKVPVPITVYLFRDFEQFGESMGSLEKILKKDLAERYKATVGDYARRGKRYDGKPRPDYTIKRLGDYVSEGVEDELLCEDLQFWREENGRRKDQAEARELSQIDRSV